MPISRYRHFTIVLGSVIFLYNFFSSIRIASGFCFASLNRLKKPLKKKSRTLWLNSDKELNHLSTVS